MNRRNALHVAYSKGAAMSPENPPPVAPPGAEVLAEKIDALTAHIPDDDERAELAAHLEDTALAYLTGQRHLSPEDALLLATSHLGPAALTPRLAPEFLVRVVAAAGATAASWVFASLLAHTTQQIILRSLRGAHDPSLAFFGVLAIAGAVWFLILLVLSLKLADRFMHRSLRTSLPLFVLLPILVMSVDRVFFYVPFPGLFMRSELPPWVFQVWSLAAVTATFAALVFWLRFTDRSGPTLPRRMLSIAAWAMCVSFLLIFADPLHPTPFGPLVALTIPWFLTAIPLPLLVTLLLVSLHTLVNRPANLPAHIAN